MQRRYSLTTALVATALGALRLTVPTTSYAGPWHRRDVRHDRRDLRADWREVRRGRRDLRHDVRAHEWRDARRNRQELRGEWRDLHQDLR